MIQAATISEQPSCTGVSSNASPAMLPIRLSPLSTTPQIQQSNDDETLLTIAPLKQADDFDVLRTPCSEDIALQKLITLRSQGADFWIASINEVPVAYAIGIVRGDSYRLEGVFVHPAWRKHGIGLALERAQIDFARSLGCTDVYSNVHRENEASIHLQRKLGFSFYPSGDGYSVRLRF